MSLVLGCLGEVVEDDRSGAVVRWVLVGTGRASYASRWSWLDLFFLMFCALISGFFGVG